MCFQRAYIHKESNVLLWLRHVLSGEPLVRCGVRARGAAPERSTLRVDVAEQLGMNKGDVSGGKSAGAGTGDDRAMRIASDVVALA